MKELVEETNLTEVLHRELNTEYFLVKNGYKQCACEIIIIGFCIVCLKNHHLKSIKNNASPLL